MHIYCINLERRRDRRESVQTEFTRSGFDDVEFFPATDGRVNTPDGLYITPPEYGCASSHVRVWRDMVAKGYKSALVFEDDVHLLPNFKTKLEGILEDAPSEWDMIFLGHITPIVRQYISEKLFEGQPLGTHAYLINIECARKLCNFDPKLMKVGIDFQLNRFPIRILCTKEILASQGDLASEKGFMSFKSMFEGDIGIERTWDFDFLIRMSANYIAIFLFTLLVLSLAS